MRNILMLAILLATQLTFSQFTVNGSQYQEIDNISRLWGSERGVDLPFAITEYYEDPTTQWIMIDKRYETVAQLRSALRPSLFAAPGEFPVLYIWVNGRFEDPIIYSTWRPTQINISGWEDVVMRWYWPNTGIPSVPTNQIPIPIGDPVVIIKR